MYTGGKLLGSLLFPASREKTRLAKRGGQELVQVCTSFKLERPGPGYQAVHVRIHHQFPTEEERDKFAVQLLGDDNPITVTIVPIGSEECRGTMTIGKVVLKTVIVTAR